MSDAKSVSVEFELPSDPRGMRNIRMDVVGQLDGLLGSAGGEVLHAIDPRRLLAFAFGGPPVWSVAVTTPAPGVHQYLTYGLSRAVDPAAPFGFELAIRVRSPEAAPVWPTLLLRTIARYHLTTGREIAPGQFIDLGAPITQSPVAPAERHLMPSTRMDTVFILGGASVPTPAGPLEIRNVFGLDAAERDLLQCVHNARFAGELRRRDPSLTVDIASPSLSADATFVAAMEEASRTEGSDCTAECIPDLHWTDDGTAFEILISGAHAKRLQRRLRSRLPFGKGLLLHAAGPGPGSEVLVLPAGAIGVPEHNATRLVLELPVDSTYVTFLREGDTAHWRFRYA